MIDLIVYSFAVLFGFGLGTLFGWVLSLPDEKKNKSENEDYITNCSAHIDMDEWKKCIDECPYYTYESKPKKKKRKK